MSAVGVGDNERRERVVYGHQFAFPAGDHGGATPAPIAILANDMPIVWISQRII
jgi:hypothetical protein